MQKILEDVQRHLTYLRFDQSNLVSGHRPKDGARSRLFSPRQEKISLLDVATGTGDQLFTLMDRSKNIAQAVGVDPAGEMLLLAQEKSKRKPYRFRIEWKQAWADDLPFIQSSFDCATISFGIRNVPIR